MNFIPRRTRVKSEVYRNVTFLDLFVGLVGFAGTLMLMFSNLPYNFYIGLSFMSFWVMLFVPVSDGVKLYYSFVLMFKFIAYKKNYYKNFEKNSEDIRRIIPFVGVNTNKYIDFGDNYAMVLEIFPTAFHLLDETKREMIINNLGTAFSRLAKNQKMSIIKTKKPMLLDELALYEDEKYDTLLKLGDRGIYTDLELDARSPVFEERLRAISHLNHQEKIIKNHYYMVIYDTDRELLESTVNGIASNLMTSQTPIYSDILTGNKLFVFLRSTFNENFNERELDALAPDAKVKWAIPNSIKFKINTTSIDDELYRTFTVTDYPIEVPHGWLYPLFELDQARVVVNIDPIEKHVAERTIDRSLIEMELRMRRSMKTSEEIESQTHYDTLRELLVSLKNNNQNLYNVNIHITAEEGIKKEIRANLRQNGFKYAENFGRQIDAFVSSNISRLDTLQEYMRGIHTTAIAAGFPFISSVLQDRRGFYLGYNQYPVFTNFFMRNTEERVNSNMMIIGKSGSGKSFATKTLLTNFAADNTRIFILDPENEYEIMCKNLGGKIIDVGSGVNGIFNPFHIYTSLEADEGLEDDSFNSHLQFLEQFFRVILDGINPDAFETVNSLVVDLYKLFQIDSNTRLDILEPHNYPIFDDLIELTNLRLETETEPFVLRNLQTVKTYIAKFGTGGRNSNLWNGYTSIQTNENFICFNFRTLIANRNDTIASAQMLLIFKYLNSEIIKNRDFNLRYFAGMEDEEDKRRIIVAVDEAHVFINPKYPIALDFMAQMAKRIRKYSGMQIIITQNIKDFVGSEEIAQQSTAIINASQYSMIFSLSPNDITDLIELYRNAGGINKEEQDSIVTASRGRAFLITGPSSRTMVNIEALSFVKDLFEKDFGVEIENII